MLWIVAGHSLGADIAADNLAAEGSSTVADNLVAVDSSAADGGRCQMEFPDIHHYFVAQSDVALRAAYLHRAGCNLVRRFASFEMTFRLSRLTSGNTKFRQRLKYSAPGTPKYSSAGINLSLSELRHDTSTTNFSAN